MAKNPRKFWKTIPLKDMDHLQWESLCDGCGKCCLRKLQFEDTGEIAYTRVACRLLDLHACRCRSYGQRSSLNPECLILTPENLASVSPLLPGTCAYRLIFEGRDFPGWHPLLTGDPGSVHRANRSVRGLVLCEDDILQEDLEDHIIDWA